MLSRDVKNYAKVVKYWAEELTYHHLVFLVL